MVIWVMYPTKKYDMVKDNMLDELIANQKIAKFYRSSGWVTLGVDPIRGMGGDRYKGQERRSRPNKSLHEQLAPLVARRGV